MSLALIDKHIRQKQNIMDENQRQTGTLIIVPTSVLLQWE